MNDSLRLKEGMSLQGMITALCRDGGGVHPGAVVICCDLLKKGAGIDVNNPQGGLGLLLDLDLLHIYFIRIHKLYAFCCGSSLAKMVTLIRAAQMKVAGMDATVINRCIDNPQEKIDFEAVHKAVKDQLPGFDPLNLAAQ